MRTKSSLRAKAKRTPEAWESKSESEVEMEEKGGKERMDESDDTETESRERIRRQAVVDGDAQLRESLLASGRKRPPKRSGKFRCTLNSNVSMGDQIVCSHILDECYTSRPLRRPCIHSLKKKCVLTVKHASCSQITQATNVTVG